MSLDSFPNVPILKKGYISNRLRLFLKYSFTNGYIAISPNVIHLTSGLSSNVNNIPIILHTAFSYAVSSAVEAPL
jgi:hypothetical protein